MKCDCEECQGTGVIDCPDCEGTGVIEGGIQSAALDPTNPKYKELRALRNDATRAEDNAHRLIELKPEHSESYLKQLKETLQAIEDQWEKVTKSR